MKKIFILGMIISCLFVQVVNAAGETAKNSKGFYQVITAEEFMWCVTNHPADLKMELQSDIDLTNLIKGNGVSLTNPSIRGFNHKVTINSESLFDVVNFGQGEGISGIAIDGGAIVRMATGTDGGLRNITRFDDVVVFPKNCGGLIGIVGNSTLINSTLVVPERSIEVSMPKPKQ